MTLLGVIGIVELFLILGVILVFFLLPLIAVVDIIRSKFEGNLQLIWIVVIAFFNVFGAILYFIIGRNQKIVK